MHHFRRERPRLAELEVYTIGDNVVNLTQRIRNRDVSIFANLLLSLVTDGFFRSFFPLRVYDQVRNRNQLQVDLGARFWLDRVRLVSAEGPLSAYQLRLSDGRLDPDGSLLWEALEERQNRESFLQLEEQFPLREVRYLELRRLELVGRVSEAGNLSEIQAYGEGYVSKVELESPIIRLGRSRILSAVEWDGDQPPGTQLEIRTRSGDDIIEERHYFDVVGARDQPRRVGVHPLRAKPRRGGSRGNTRVGMEQLERGLSNVGGAIQVAKPPALRPSANTALDPRTVAYGAD